VRKGKKILPKLIINSESFSVGDSLISSRTSRKAIGDKVYVSNLGAVKQMSIQSGFVSVKSGESLN
jgi:hypothetical protein